MNDLLCADGNALNMPEYASYIPMDLSTALQLNGIDPDITREEFVGSKAVSDLKNTEPFSRWGEDMKHNCLWDAAVCKMRFDNIIIRIVYAEFLSLLHTHLNPVEP